MSVCTCPRYHISYHTKFPYSEKDTEIWISKDKKIIPVMSIINSLITFGKFKDKLKQKREEGEIEYEDMFHEIPEKEHKEIIKITADDFDIIKYKPEIVLSTEEIIIPPPKIPLGFEPTDFKIEDLEPIEPKPFEVVTPEKIPGEEPKPFEVIVTPPPKVTYDITYDDIAITPPPPKITKEEEKEEVIVTPPPKITKEEEKEEVIVIPPPKITKEEEVIVTPPPKITKEEEISYIDIQPILDKYNDLMERLFTIYNNIVLKLKDCVPGSNIEYILFTLPTTLLPNKEPFIGIIRELIERFQQNIDKVLDIIRIGYAKLKKIDC